MGDFKMVIAEGHRNQELHNIRKILQSHGSKNQVILKQNIGHTQSSVTDLIAFNCTQQPRKAPCGLGPAQPPVCLGERSFSLCFLSSHILFSVWKKESTAKQIELKLAMSGSCIMQTQNHELQPTCASPRLTQFH
jgi:hypothetical protein